MQLRKVQLLKYVFFHCRPKFGNVAINANFFSGLMIEVKLTEKLSIRLRHLKVLDRSGKVENSDCDIVHWPRSLGH